MYIGPLHKKMSKHSLKINFISQTFNENVHYLLFL